MFMFFVIVGGGLLAALHENPLALLVIFENFRLGSPILGDPSTWAIKVPFCLML
jgi:hypothetical protein